MLSGVSDVGNAQLAALSEAIRAAGLAQSAELFVCSPLSRAIETALAGLRSLNPIQNDNLSPVKLVACGLATEVLDTACDVGTPVKQLMISYPEVNWAESVGFYRGKVI